MVVRYCLTLLVAALGSAATIKNPEERLVEGYDAPKGAFPYQAVITFEGYIWCGGSLIANEWILTTAACVEGLPLDALSVQVGSSVKLGKNASKVLEVINHEEYNKYIRKNNVALLKVERLAFTKTVQAVALDEIRIGVPEILTVSSYGGFKYARADSFNITFNLTYLDVVTRNTKFCKIFTHLEENDVCASALQRQGVCVFSTGSPLVRLTEIGSKLGFKQVGIASRGFWGGDSDIYVEVAPYIPWIKEKCDNCI